MWEVTKESISLIEATRIRGFLMSPTISFPRTTLRRIGSRSQAFLPTPWTSMTDSIARTIRFHRFPNRFRWVDGINQFVNEWFQECCYWCLPSRLPSYHWRVNWQVPHRLLQKACSWISTPHALLLSLATRCESLCSESMNFADRDKHESNHPRIPFHSKKKVLLRDVEVHYSDVLSHSKESNFHYSRYLKQNSDTNTSPPSPNKWMWMITLISCFVNAAPLTSLLSSVPLISSAATSSTLIEELRFWFLPRLLVWWWFEC